jgi:hypothetical protein
MIQNVDVNRILMEFLQELAEADSVEDSCT